MPSPSTSAGACRNRHRLGGRDPDGRCHVTLRADGGYVESHATYQRPSSSCYDGPPDPRDAVYFNGAPFACPARLQCSPQYVTETGPQTLRGTLTRVGMPRTTYLAGLGYGWDQYLLYGR